MLTKKVLFFILLFLLVVSFKARKLNKYHYEKKLKRVKETYRSAQQMQQNFHDVDAFGEDFVDFGAKTGNHGQFSWHADFPIE